MVMLAISFFSLGKKSHRFKSTVFLLLFFVTKITHSQQISKLDSLYRVIDTTLVDNTSMLLKVLWMDSLIQIRNTTSLKYDLEYQRKFRRDSTFVPTSEDTLRYNAMRKTASQNCHSYALERYLRYHKVADQVLFTDKTILKENRQMDKILETAFKKDKTVKTKPRRNLESNFSKGSLLVFRNSWGSPIHTVFYDSAFHSKYGGLTAKAEKGLKPILKRYWDTVTIDEYRIDSLKVERYLRLSEKKN
jgi:hypothetical protein